MNLSQELSRSLFDGIYSSFIDWRNDYLSYALGANLSYIYIHVGINIRKEPLTKQKLLILGKIY
jgi:hypothetical protein